MFWRVPGVHVGRLLLSLATEGFLNQQFRHALAQGLPRARLASDEEAEQIRRYFRVQTADFLIFSL